MSPHPEPELSPGAAACFLLFWQEPTDRALIGWQPFGYASGLNDEQMLVYLTSEVSMSSDERRETTGRWRA